MSTVIKIRRFKTDIECLEFEDHLAEIVGAKRVNIFTYNWGERGITQDVASDMKYVLLTVEDDNLAMRIKLALGGWL